MAIKGVLFDFSGTLLRIESTESWLRATLEACELTLADEEFRHYVAELEAAGALPGGAPPGSVPAHLEELWTTRDVSAERHRAAYTGLSREVPLPAPGLHEALYDRHKTPAAWRPYPDTADVLAALKERGLLVGVVSNIGWDLRPIFRAHRLDRYVDAYVLSYEHGVRKPDPRLFAVACEMLGVPAGDTLMVGDEPHSDGGAAALGCAVHFVDHLPVEQRPAGLEPVLALLD
ncbi:HAD family hydrolase [Streptomyces sp. Da 82-17]|uniref:HAD family hydrolase n=1 Tax=Streptomyces sp. Da 82-17 TaxID=3377116 RepID=UPI0038D4CFC6